MKIRTIKYCGSSLISYKIVTSGWSVIKYLQDEVIIPLKVSTSRCNLALLVDLRYQISEKRKRLLEQEWMSIQPHLSKIAIKVINGTVYKKNKVNPIQNDL